MAYTEIYVDPSLDASPQTGTGTVGDPYSDLEYAIIQSTFDTTNGTRINVKAGTDEVLSAALNTALADTSVSVAWVPGPAAPLIIQGYTTAAADGGVGGISGGGSVGIITGGTYNGVYFIDMHLHNTGAATVVDLNDDCGVIRCEIDNTTGAGVLLDAWGQISQNYIHNIGTFGAQVFSGYIAYNYFENGTNQFTYCVTSQAVDTTVIDRNIMKLDGASDGIWLQQKMIVTNNSIWSNAGTGQGITMTDSGNYNMAVNNNIVEGFSGTGGIGFDLDDATSEFVSFMNNSAYNNATEYNLPANPMITMADNETLGASPFTSASTGDFQPVDTGGVKEGSWPQIIGGGHV